MIRNSTAAVAALAIATICCRPSTAFLSWCHVLRPAQHPSRAFPTLDAAPGVGMGMLSERAHTWRRSGSPHSSGGFSRAQRESGWTSTSSSGFRERPPCQQGGGMLMSLDGGGEESNALLLRMDFEHAEVEELREWIRRYPFGTALPVQPFSLVETEAGIDVLFRKKPTLERGSQDGGLSFTVENAVEAGGDLRAGPTLTMRRISKGQEIRKMFAERIVVKAVVQALAGVAAPPGTKVRTVLHEGLV